MSSSLTRPTTFKQHIFFQAEVLYIDKLGFYHPIRARSLLHRGESLKRLFDKHLWQEKIHHTIDINAGDDNYHLFELGGFLAIFGIGFYLLFTGRNETFPF